MFLHYNQIPKSILNRGYTKVISKSIVNRLIRLKSKESSKRLHTKSNSKEYNR